MSDQALTVFESNSFVAKVRQDDCFYGDVAILLQSLPVAQSGSDWDEAEARARALEVERLFSTLDGAELWEDAEQRKPYGSMSANWRTTSRIALVNTDISRKVLNKKGCGKSAAKRVMRDLLGPCMPQKSLDEKNDGFRSVAVAMTLHLGRVITPRRAVACFQRARNQGYELTTYGWGLLQRCGKSWPPLPPSASAETDGAAVGHQSALNSRVGEIVSVGSWQISPQSYRLPSISAINQPASPPASVVDESSMSEDTAATRGALFGHQMPAAADASEFGRGHSLSDYEDTSSAAKTGNNSFIQSSQQPPLGLQSRGASTVVSTCGNSSYVPAGHESDPSPAPKHPLSYHHQDEPSLLEWNLDVLGMDETLELPDFLLMTDEAFADLVREADGGAVLLWKW